jgi:outer membrane protein TolC
MAAIAVAAAGVTVAAQTSPQREPGQPQTSPTPPPQPTPLGALIDELTRNNPDVIAARHAATAATYVAPQVSSLPDPQATLQHMTVGSPLPFDGYLSNNFAYIGVGVSQTLPYPGKRALRGDVARDDADVTRAQVDIVSSDRIEQLKMAYVRLAYVQATRAILERDATLLEPIEQQARARYASGQGNQQDVLRAQLERTKILRELSMNDETAGEAQAEIKRLVARPQDGPDILTEPLAVNLLRPTNAELLDQVRAKSPDVRERSAVVTRNETAVSLAQKEFRPDFGVGFMYQNTGPSFPDYYMATFNVTFHRRGPKDAALAQARVNVDRAAADRDGMLQNALGAVQKQYVVAKTSEEQLLIYRDGLIPQAQASVQAGLAAYQSDRADFQTVLASFLDVVTLELDYQHTLFDHETALIQIERLAGVSLR